MPAPTHFRWLAKFSRRALVLIAALCAVGSPHAHAAWAAAAADAVEWYDTLRLPNAGSLPYVRVATGRWMKRGNQEPENRFTEGFLVSEDATSFTVFVCNVSRTLDPFDSSEPAEPLQTIRFVRQANGPAHTLVNYEVLDFAKVSNEALERVRERAAKGAKDPASFRLIFQRASIFAFGRACLQKGLEETAAGFLDIAVNLPDPQTGKAAPDSLRKSLQQQLGDAELIRINKRLGDASLSWADLLKAYEEFETRFPENPKVATTQATAAILRDMIKEESEHRAKPLESMSPTEQVAENIYQLRNLGNVMWIMNSRYPIYTRKEAGQEVITPVHRLVDLGDAAVPALIDALDDRRFTRCLEYSFHTQFPPANLRVGDVALRILNHLSGKRFYSRREKDGRLTDGTAQQQAEAWWAEKQAKGEKQVLLDATAAGGDDAAQSARLLVEKHPDSADAVIAAIETALPKMKYDSQRGELIEIAGKLPGDASLAYLRSKLGGGHGFPSQVRAAEALVARGHADVMPTMIEAWRRIQPRLLSNQSETYQEAGLFISFLAQSADQSAIEALAREARKAPVDVRLAIASAFAPYPKQRSMSANGLTVNARTEMKTLPDGAAGRAIERLLISALDDQEPRRGMKGYYNEFSFEDPRVCDMAALVLSLRWPDKYQFKWAGDPKECDAQITKIRERWRTDHRAR